VECRQPFSAAGVDDHRVKRFVDVEDCPRVDRRCTRDRAQLTVDPHQLRCDLLPPFRSERRDFRAGQRLQMADQPIQLARIVARQRRDDDAGVAFFVSSTT
jgi:hypothetical protein